MRIEQQPYLSGISTDQPTSWHCLSSLLQAAFCIALGLAITLSLRGYAFGQSNHTLYLLEAVHWLNPQLLNNDWYVSHTLQYHLVFGAITRWLMLIGWEQAGFLIAYLLTLVTMHIAWYGIVRQMGAGSRAYLLSVVLFYLSAAGTGLGGFQFDQDGSFLPSNVANVCMLWSIWFWMQGNRGASGVALGLAGLWHINHAAVGIGLYAALCLWEAWRPVSGTKRWTWQQTVGAVVLVGLSLVNLVPALIVKMQTHPNELSLDQFVQLYVYLRHPHHYGPRTWPWIVWAGFLWSQLLALVAARRAAHTQMPASQRIGWVEARRVFGIFWILLVIGLLGAGFWFVSDTIIQLAVYRFTIYLQMLACAAVAWWVFDSGKWQHGAVVLWVIVVILLGAFSLLTLVEFEGILATASSFVAQNITPLLTFTTIVLLIAILTSRKMPASRLWVMSLHGGGLAVVIALIVVGWGRWYGLHLIPVDDAQYIEVARWAQMHTPEDAVFLVPPNEQAFRLDAQRAIYINFKGVPQLRSEIATWRDRLLEVLNLKDFSTLPRGFDQTLEAIGQRYESLETSYLVDLARRRGIEYILVNHPLDASAAVALVYQSSSHEYLLYKVNQPSQ